MDKIIPIKDEINGDEITGKIVISRPKYLERMEVFRDIMQKCKGLKDDETQLVQGMEAMKYFLTRVKKVDLKFQDQHFKDKNCIEYYDEIAQLMAPFAAELLQGEKLGKK